MFIRPVLQQGECDPRDLGSVVVHAQGVDHLRGPPMPGHRASCG
jgi:hypothetical protein